MGWRIQTQSKFLTGLVGRGLLPLVAIALALAAPPVLEAQPPADSPVPVSLGENCPESLSNSDLVLRWPGACGEGTPPNYLAEVDDPMIGAEGLWNVTFIDHEWFVGGQTAITKGRGGLGLRTLPAGWSQYSYIWNADRSSTVRAGTWPVTIEDGAISFGLSAYSRFIVTVRPQDDGNTMVGQWTQSGKKGRAILRRAPAPILESATFYSHTKDEAGHPVTSTVGAGQGPATVWRHHPISCGYGGMAGNCPTFSVKVFGKHLDGPHHLWLDPASFMYITGPRYLHQADGKVTSSSYATTDGKAAEVVGVQMTILMRDGTKPGRYTIWIDAQPVEFELHLAGYPGTEDAPPFTERPTNGVDLAVDLPGEGFGTKPAWLFVGNNGEEAATEVRFSIASDDLTREDFQVEACASDDDCSPCRNSEDSGMAAVLVTCDVDRLEPGELLSVHLRPRVHGSESEGWSVFRDIESQGDYQILDDCGDDTTAKRLTFTALSKEDDLDTSNNTLPLTVDVAPHVHETTLKFVTFRDGGFVDADELHMTDQFWIEATTTFDADVGCAIEQHIERSHERKIDVSWNGMSDDADTVSGPIEVTAELLSVRDLPDGRKRAFTRTNVLYADAFFESSADQELAIDPETGEPDEQALQTELTFIEGPVLVTAKLDATTDSATVQPRPGTIRIDPIPRSSLLGSDRTIAGSGTYRVQLRLQGADAGTEDSDNVLGAHVEHYRVGDDVPFGIRSISLTPDKNGVYYSPLTHVPHMESGARLRVRFANATADGEGADALTVDTTAGDPLDVVFHVGRNNWTTADQYGMQVILGGRFKVVTPRMPEGSEPPTIGLVLTRGTSAIGSETLQTLPSGDSQQFETAPQFLASHNALGEVKPGDILCASIQGIENTESCVTVAATDKRVDELHIAARGSAQPEDTSLGMIGQPVRIEAVVSSRDRDSRGGLQSERLDVGLSFVGRSGNREIGPITLQPLVPGSNLFVSEHITLDAATLGGALANGDRLETYYPIDETEGFVEAAVQLQALDPTVLYLDLTAYDGESARADGNVHLGGAMKATVGFDDAPLEDIERIDLRATRNGKVVNTWGLNVARSSDDPNVFVSRVSALPSSEGFATLLPGDIIEARFADLEFGDGDSSALSVIGTPGKLHAVQFVLHDPEVGTSHGQPVAEAKIGSHVALEVQFEAKPEGYFGSTDIKFIAPDGREDTAFNALRAVESSATLATYRSASIELIGDIETNSSGLRNNLTPGVRLEADILGRRASLVLLPGDLPEGKGRILVTAKDSFGHDYPLSVRAKPLSDGYVSDREFSTNTPVDLTAGTYDISVRYPTVDVVHKGITLTAGETTTVDVSANLGRLRTMFRDSYGRPRQYALSVDPREVRAKGEWGGGLKTSSDRIHLPSGTYDVYVDFPKGKGSDTAAVTSFGKASFASRSFENVTIRPGEETVIEDPFSNGYGRVKIAVHDADGKSLQKRARMRTSKGSSQEFSVPTTIEVPAGEKVEVDLLVGSEFMPMTKAITVESQQERTLLFELGRFTAVNRNFAGGTVPSAIYLLSPGADNEIPMKSGAAIDLPPGTYRVKFTFPQEEVLFGTVRPKQPTTVESRQKVASIRVQREQWMQASTVAVTNVETSKTFDVKIGATEPFLVSPGRYSFRYKEVSDSGRVDLQLRNQRLRGDEQRLVRFHRKASLVFSADDGWKTSYGEALHVFDSNKRLIFRERLHPYGQPLTTFLEPGTYQIYNGLETTDPTNVGRFVQNKFVILRAGDSKRVPAP